MTRALTTKEAAELIAKKTGYPMSPVTVRALCRKGRIVARKHGTGWAVDSDELKEFDRSNQWIRNPNAKKEAEERRANHSIAREENKDEVLGKICGKCGDRAKECNGLYLNLAGKSRRIFVCNSCCGISGMFAPSSGVLTYTP
jgi:hypothetical protein